MKTQVEQNILHFNIDVPEFLNELQGNATPKQSYIMRAPMQILKEKLRQIATIAIRLDDPELNILMLETKLFDVAHEEIQTLIQNQKNRTNKL